MKRFAIVATVFCVSAVLFASHVQAGHIGVSCRSQQAAVVLADGCHSNFVALRAVNLSRDVVVLSAKQRVLVVEQRVVRDNRRVSILDRLLRQSGQRSRSLSIQRTVVR